MARKGSVPKRVPVGRAARKETKAEIATSWPNGARVATTVRYNPEDHDLPATPAALSQVHADLEMEASNVCRHFFQNPEFPIQHVHPYIFVMPEGTRITSWPQKAIDIYSNLNSYDIVIVRAADPFTIEDFTTSRTGNGPHPPAGRGMYPGFGYDHRIAYSYELALGAYTAPR